MKTVSVLLVLGILAIALCYADECQPGDTKLEDCNNCKCVAGNWACTRKICRPLVKRQTTCVPGTTFKQDCNTCTCSSDGRNAACTLRACPPH